MNFEEKFNESVSDTERQPYESIENNTNSTTSTGKNYNEILNQSFNVLKTMKGIKYTQRTNAVKTLVTSMELLYTSTIYTDNLDNRIILAHAYLNLSHVYIDSSEIEASCFCRDCLIKCILLLKDNELNSKVILLALKVYNELGKTWILIKNLELSKFYFQTALKFYMSYTRKNDQCLTPVNIVIIDCQNKEDNKSTLENLYILTLENLVQIYNTNLAFNQSENHKAALYMRMLLRIKLSKVPSTVGYFEWALQAASLSEYFAMYNYFKDAKGYLTAACSMMLKVYEVYVNIDEKQSPTEKAQLYDKYQSGVASIAISWARYGIFLLDLSYQKLMHNMKRDNSSENVFTSKLTVQSENQLMELLFSDETKDIKKLNPQITDDYITKYSDAKEIFEIIIKWLNKAEAYNIPEKYKLLYVTIKQDVSKAYKYLAKYEVNKNDHIILQEERIITLKNALKILDTVHDIDICKQIWTEMITIYFALIDVEIEDPNNHTVRIMKTESFQRISELSNYIIYYLQLYLN